MTAEATDEKVDDRAAAGAHSRSIEMNIRAFLVSVTEDVDAALEGIAAFTVVTTSMISESPFALVGLHQSLRKISLPVVNDGDSAMSSLGLMKPKRSLRWLLHSQETEKRRDFTDAFAKRPRLRLPMSRSSHSPQYGDCCCDRCCGIGCSSRVFGRWIIGSDQR